MKIFDLNLISKNNSFILCQGHGVKLIKKEMEPGDIPEGTQFVYLAKNYIDDVGIPNSVQSSWGTYGIRNNNNFNVNGSGSECFISMPYWSNDFSLEMRIDNEQLEMIKGVNGNVATFYFRAYDNGAHPVCGGLMSTRSEGGYEYMIRCEQGKLQIHGGSGENTIPMVDGNVIKVEIDGGNVIVKDLDNDETYNASLDVSYRDMGYVMTTFNAGYDDEFYLDKLYGMAFINRRTTNEEDETFRNILHNESV